MLAPRYAQRIVEPTDVNESRRKANEIDDVILPEQTRPRIIDALDMLSNKRDENPPKKHGNIPL